MLEQLWRARRIAAHGGQCSLQCWLLRTALERAKEAQRRAKRG
jgi:hypothetical protein